MSAKKSIQEKIILRDSFRVNSFGEEYPPNSTKLAGYRIKTIRVGNYHYISSTGNITSQKSEKIINALKNLKSPLIKYKVYQIPNSSKVRIYIKNNFDEFVDLIKARIYKHPSPKKQNIRIYERGNQVEEIFLSTPQHILREFLQLIIDSAELKSIPIENNYTIYSCNYNHKLDTLIIHIDSLMKTDSEKIPSWTQFHISFTHEKITIVIKKHNMNIKTYRKKISKSIYFFLALCKSTIYQFNTISLKRSALSSKLRQNLQKNEKLKSSLVFLESGTYNMIPVASAKKEFIKELYKLFPHNK